jgi:hypothetical protein
LWRKYKNLRAMSFQLQASGCWLQAASLCPCPLDYWTNY